MDHFERLTQASNDLWRNPSILGVLVLQYVLILVVGLFFLLLDMLLIGALNGTSLFRDFASPQELLNVIWNVKTIVAVSSVAVVEIAILLFVVSVFTAGALGMMRNLLLDGSTTFQEFPSMAKRFTGAVFRFTLLRYACLILPSVPFIFALISLLGTTPELITTSQFVFFGISLTVLLGIWILVAFFLMYGDAAIVFEDLGAIDAAKRTWGLVRKHTLASFLTGALGLASFIVFSIAVALISMPTNYLARSTGAIGWTISDQIVGFIGNVVMMAVGIIVSIFLMRTYRWLTGGTIRTAPYRTKKKS